MTARDDFLALLRAARAVRLAALDADFDRAQKDEDAARLAEIRRERRSLLDLPAALEGDSRDRLIAHWPPALGPLPQWFVAPETVGKAGKPMAIDCRPPPPAAAVPDDQAAAIVARRRARAAIEDRERGDGPRDGRHVIAEDLGL